MKTVNFNKALDSGIIVLSKGQIKKCKKNDIVEVCYSMHAGDPSPQLIDDCGDTVFDLIKGKLTINKAIQKQTQKTNTMKTINNRFDITKPILDAIVNEIGEGDLSDNLFNQACEEFHIEEEKLMELMLDSDSYEFIRDGKGWIVKR